MKSSKALFSKVVMAILLSLGCATRSQAQTNFDLWPDRSSGPSMDQLAFMPLPGIYHVLSDQTVEKDGEEYQAVQWFKDSEFFVTAQTGQYILGLLGEIWPEGTVDPVAQMKMTRLVAVEIDGEVYELDESYISFVSNFPADGLSLGSYNFFPRFNKPGEYTLRYRYRQLEPFFFAWPYAAIKALGGGGPSEDPLGLEGRRVLVAEQEGDPADGEMVVTYRLTVKGSPTAVEDHSWGFIKKKQALNKFSLMGE